ncbi:MAG: hypothetical protein KAS32_25075 [Candidatus Peribacteraceae bacterium]|nr:hypothetical protein [Candidatus Peribacteraceae bacterium]
MRTITKCKRCVGYEGDLRLLYSLRRAIRYARLRGVKAGSVLSTYVDEWEYRHWAISVKPCACANHPSGVPFHYRPVRVGSESVIRKPSLDLMGNILITFPPESHGLRSIAIENSTSYEISLEVEDYETIENLQRVKILVILTNPNQSAK